MTPHTSETTRIHHMEKGGSNHKVPPLATLDSSDGSCYKGSRCQWQKIFRARVWHEPPRCETLVL